jgi:hypothetical protein
MEELEHKRSEMEELEEAYDGDPLKWK